MKTFRTRILSLLFIAALTMLNVTACGARSSSEQSHAIDASALSAGPILPVAAAGDDFFYEQRITVSWPDGERGFSAALQKVNETLSVVALGPMGQPAFRIQLREGEVTMEAFTDRTLPFPPEYIVADVQKAFFEWIEPPPGVASDERAGTFEELHVEEQFSHGALRSRTFSRSDAPEAGLVEVTFTDNEAREIPDVKIVNGWFGYTLTVVTNRVGSL